MRCPSCNAENADDARKCAACGAKLQRRPRRRASEVADGPLTHDAALGSPATRAAYRCVAYGLIPVAGLVLGPMALVLGLIAYRRDRAAPEPKTNLLALLLAALGAVIALTNWVGLTLVVLGLTWPAT